MGARKDVMYLDLSFLHTWSQLAANEVPDKHAAAATLETIAHDPDTVGCKHCWVPRYSCGSDSPGGVSVPIGLVFVHQINTSINTPVLGSSQVHVYDLA